MHESKTSDLINDNDCNIYFGARDDWAKVHIPPDLYKTAIFETCFRCGAKLACEPKAYMIAKDMSKANQSELRFSCVQCITKNDNDNRQLLVVTNPGNQAKIDRYNAEKN